MAYDELEDRDMGLEDSEMYEDESLYEPADTFGEQIGESGGVNSDYEATEEHRGSGSTEPSPVEEAFGETLSHETNPHLSDQLEDQNLGEEAQADYSDTELEE